MKKFLGKKYILLYVVLLILLAYVAFSYTKKVEQPEYGVSFNTVYAQELGLNWKEVYDAVLNELGVRKIRLAAHWTLVEERQGAFDFSKLDYQVEEAQRKGVEIIFAVGKRLPRWPECHVPDWAWNMSKEEEEAQVLRYITETVNRYKGIDAITTWQVENEPFLSVFAVTHCKNFDKKFLQKEIDLVRSLDDRQRPILVTDSGELSTWRKSFAMGDIFGTTMYVYSWNSFMGAFRNPFLPGFYTFRQHFWQLFYPDVQTIIAELSLEPWLDKPIIKEKTEIQIERMSPQKFQNVLEFARQTGIRTQYLWGAEWWYYMKLQQIPWYWDTAKELFPRE